MQVCDAHYSPLFSIVGGVSRGVLGSTLVLLLRARRAVGVSEIVGLARARRSVSSDAA